MLIPMNHTNEAHSCRIRDRIANRYAYVAIPAGIMSVFFSFGSLITNANLVFPVGILRSRASVNLTVGDPLLNMTLWTISMILFLIYPAIIRKTGPSRALLVGHGALFLILLSAFFWPETVWVLSIANTIAALFALLTSSRTFRVARTRTILLSLATFLLFLIPVEALALSEEMSNPGAAWSALWLYAPARLDASLYNLAFYATPYLVVLLMLSPVLSELTNQWLKPRCSSTAAKNTPSLLHNRVALACGLVGVVVFAGLVGYFPYFLTQDSGMLFGVDVSWYVQQLDALQRGNSIPFLIAQQQRAAYLLLLYGLRSVAGLSIAQTFASASTLVTILFATSSFFLAREVGRGNSVAVLAGLLASVAPQILDATRTGIYANWLADVEILFFLALLLSSIRTRSKITLAGCLVVSLLLLITHAYSWAVFMVILALSLLISLLRDRSWRSVWRSQTFRALLGSISMALVILLVWSTFTSLGSALIALRQMTGSYAAHTGFLMNLGTALGVFGAGYYSNWLLLCLSVVGVFGLAKMESESRTLLLSLILVPSLACFFVEAMLQWRLLFLIPYHVFAALGLFSLLAVMGRAATGHVDTALYNTVRIGSCAFLVLLFLNSTIRAMAILAM